MKTISAIILILFYNPIFSQVTKDSSKLAKNEFGIDLIPAIKLLSQTGFGNIQTKFSLQYKRQLKNNIYYRIGASLSKQNNYNSQFLQFSTTYYNTNATEKIQQSPELRLNSGLEYRFGKKRITFFTGMDLGYMHNQSSNTFFLLSNKDSIVSSYSTTKNGITITPFFGMQYHFTKKLFFSMQLGQELGYVFGERKINNNSIYLPAKFREFNLGGGLLNNFSLFYKF